jgi:hypothetical protein
MITSTSRALRAMLLAAVVIAPQPVTWASEAETDPAAPVRLDASRVSWQQARLKASKLLVSMDVDMRIDTHDGPAISPDFAATSEGRAIPAGEAVTGLTYVTEALGRHNVSELFLDAQTGAVLQRTAHDTGSRLRWRRYRFTDIGAMRWTARPSSDEENLPPADWSERSSELRRFPAGMPDAPLTEASALIYLVAASDLTQPGDRLQMLAYSSSSDVVHRVTVAVAERDKVSVDYRSRQGASGSRRQERVRALRVTIDGQPLPGQDDDAFELLGMHDIELYVDPETRAPLLLVGQVSILGEIRFELEELVLLD